MTIHIGITGTRAGCTPQQRAAVKDHMAYWWDRDEPVSFHFGDCIGVDAESFEWACDFRFATVAHPPFDPKLRAWCKADVVMPPRPYMVRNQDIVDVVSELIVVPSGPEADNPRSGTWATYRMAVKAGVETVVIEP